MFILTLRPENFFRTVDTYRDLLFPVLHTTCGIHRKEKEKKKKKKKAQLIDCFINRMKHTFGGNRVPTAYVCKTIYEKNMQEIIN